MEYRGSTCQFSADQRYHFVVISPTGFWSDCLWVCSQRIFSESQLTGQAAIIQHPQTLNGIQTAQLENLSPVSAAPKI